jgi:hypothetical protein
VKPTKLNWNFNANGFSKIFAFFADLKRLNPSRVKFDFLYRQQLIAQPIKFHSCQLFEISWTTSPSYGCTESSDAICGTSHLQESNPAISDHRFRACYHSFLLLGKVVVWRLSTDLVANLHLQHENAEADRRYLHKELVFLCHHSLPHP